MTDTTKYRNTSLKNQVYTAGHLLAREMTPGLALSMSQTIELLIMEKIKELGLESKLSSYTKPSIRLNEFTKSSEQRLWIAVLAKAFDDAFYSADEGAALEALRWIKHGRDFNMVCRMAGREGTYVKERMLNKVIEREAAIINNHVKIKEATNNILILKNEAAKANIRKQNRRDYSYLPKYSHTYVDR